jgi:hypothetical protein
LAATVELDGAWVDAAREITAEAETGRLPTHIASIIITLRRALERAEYIIIILLVTNGRVPFEAAGSIWSIIQTLGLARYLALNLYLYPL